MSRRCSECGRHGGGFRTVVAQAQHAQRVAEAGEAEADAALVGASALLVERPVGDVEHVVEHARRDLDDDFAERREVELGLGLGERVPDEQRSG